MILLLLALLAFQSKPIKDDPRDARVQDWCSGIDGEVIDAYRDYPELGDMIKAVRADLDKIEMEQVAEPSYRKDFNKLGDDLVTLHFAEQYDHAI